MLWEGEVTLNEFLGFCLIANEQCVCKQERSKYFLHNVRD